MLRRLHWLTIMLALGLLGLPLTTAGQLPTKVYRIGWLGAGPPLLEPNPSLAAFWQGLHDLSYVEGQNLVMEYRYAEGQAEGYARKAGQAGIGQVL